MKRPGRSWISCGFRPRSSHNDPLVIRMMGELGYDVHELQGYPGYAFRRLSDLNPRELALEWDRIRTAWTVGTVPVHRRRAAVPAPTSSPTRPGLHARNWRLIEEMERAKFAVWKPLELFLWQRRRVHVGGVPWIFFYEGYWEPGDPDRRGFEIGVSVHLEEPTAMARLDRVSSGFRERIENGLRKLGFEIPARENPRVNPWRGGAKNMRTEHGYLNSYYKNVLSPALYRAESLALLRWNPKGVTSVSDRRSR
jgi:hypothetical protein